MLFRHKNRPRIELQVDLGDLQNEKENLQHIVNKFVYHRDLNGTHWVSVEGSTVIINKFKVIEKKEKHEKEPPHQTAAQSWGL